MIIRTQVVYRDPRTAQKIGREIDEKEELLLDLNKVEAICKFREDETVVFIGGRDITITESYGMLCHEWCKLVGYEPIEL